MEKSVQMRLQGKRNGTSPVWISTKVAFQFAASRVLIVGAWHPLLEGIPFHLPGLNDLSR